MKKKFTLPILLLFSLHFVACNKDRSSEDGENTHSKLPLNYPFADGYCEGTSLGISITDTSFFTADTTMSLPNLILLDMPVPGDQGSQSSCSAWATIYGIGNYYSHIKTGRPYSDTGNLSPAFTYNQITQGNCTCTSLLDNLYLLKTLGACSLKAMPYIPSGCSAQPDSLQKLQAEKFKINNWERIDLKNLRLIKQAIFEKKPVLFAITTDDGFKNLDTPYIWKARIGSPGQPHAMLIAGYDDTKNSFRIMNSWTSSWADSGFAWIEYTFFLNNVLPGGYIAAE